MSSYECFCLFDSLQSNSDSQYSRKYFYNYWQSTLPETIEALDVSKDANEYSIIRVPNTIRIVNLIFEYSYRATIVLAFIA